MVVEPQNPPYTWAARPQLQWSSLTTRFPQAPQGTALLSAPGAATCCPPPPLEGQQPVGAPGGFRPGWGEPFPRGLRARQQLSPSPRGAGGSWGCNRISDRSRSENLLHAGISRFASSSCPPWKPRRGGGRWQQGGGNLSLASRARGAGEATTCCCSRCPRARAPFTPRRRHFPVSAPHLSAERKSHLMQTKVV